MRKLITRLGLVTIAYVFAWFVAGVGIQAWRMWPE
jgi:hypothetical protein